MRQPRPLLLPCILATACCLTPVSAAESGFFLQRFFGGEIRNPLQKGHEDYKKGHYQEAVDAYYKSAMENRKDDQAWYHLGLAYLKAKEFDFASNSFQTAIQLDAKIEYRYQLCLALVQGSHVRPALMKLRQIVLQEPDHDMSWTLLGRCYESLSQRGQAKSSYLKALEIAPHQGQALFLLERLDDVEPKPLYLGDTNPKDRVFSETIERGRPTGPIPISRVISDIPSENDLANQHHSDLEPLMQSYHLSRDAHIKGLSPTAVKVWEQPKAEPETSKMSTSTSEISMMPAITSESNPTPTPPVDMKPPSIDISTEDL